MISSCSKICLLFVTFVIVGCTPNNTTIIGCNNPNSNVHYEADGVPGSGIGVFDHGGYPTLDYMVLGITGGCNPNNPTDSILRIFIPHSIPDTPYTFQLVNYNIATPNNGFVTGFNYDAANGQFTINSITPDSLASGTFHGSATYNGSIMYNITNGVFTNVKIKY